MATTVTLDPVAIHNADGSFTITGKISSTANLNHIAIGESIEDGQRGNFGTANVAADGSFSYKDQQIYFKRGNFVATAYFNDKTSVQSAVAPYTFYANGHETTVDSSGQPATSTVFGKDGSSTTAITAGGLTLHSDFFDTFNNSEEPSNTFVFDPGHGLDLVHAFRAGGADHDTLSFLGADFGASPEAQLAGVLSHTRRVDSGVVIVDPTSGDKVFVGGVAKGQLANNPGDITFHS